MRPVRFLVLALLAVTSALAQQDVHILHVRKNIYMLVGAGGNITLSMGPDGVLMVDSGLANMTDKVIAAIDQLNRQLAADPSRSGAPAKPIQYIINTHVHADHTG